MKNAKATTKQIAVRVLAIVLAALMVLGGATYAITAFLSLI